MASATVDVRTMSLIRRSKVCSDSRTDWMRVMAAASRGGHIWPEAIPRLQLHVKPDGLEQIHFLVMEAISIASVGIGHKEAIDICCVFIGFASPVGPCNKFEQRQPWNYATRTTKSS